MILYLSQGANPRIVQLFLQEKQLVLETRQVDLVAGEHRSAAFLHKNSLGQLPVLQLDSGQYISQTTAICEYLEEYHPTPPLIGTSAEERVETRMWLRRLDLLIIEPGQLPAWFERTQAPAQLADTASAVMAFRSRKTNQRNCTR